MLFVTNRPTPVIRALSTVLIAVSGCATNTVQAKNSVQNAGAIHCVSSCLYASIIYHSNGSALRLAAGRGTAEMPPYGPRSPRVPCHTFADGEVRDGPRRMNAASTAVKPVETGSRARAWLQTGIGCRGMIAGFGGALAAVAGERRVKEATYTCIRLFTSSTKDSIVCSAILPSCRRIMMCCGLRWARPGLSIPRKSSISTSKAPTLKV